MEKETQELKNKLLTSKRGGIKILIAVGILPRSVVKFGPSRGGHGWHIELTEEQKGVLADADEKLLALENYIHEQAEKARLEEKPSSRLPAVPVRATGLLDRRQMRELGFSTAWCIDAEKKGLAYYTVGAKHKYFLEEVVAFIKANPTNGGKEHGDGC